MAVITFDTHEHIKALINAGLPENQAEAIVNSQKALADSSLVTKADLHAELMPIKQDITSVKADLKIMMFLTAGMFAGVGAIFMKLFFPH
jgi:hypothetical protein